MVVDNYGFFADSLLPLTTVLCFTSHRHCQDGAIMGLSVLRGHMLAVVTRLRCHVHCIAAILSNDRLSGLKKHTLVIGRCSHRRVVPQAAQIVAVTVVT